MDVTFGATNSVNYNQVFTSGVCGVNANGANAAAATYIRSTSGFWVSTFEQKGLHILQLPFLSSL